MLKEDCEVLDNSVPVPSGGSKVKVLSRCVFLWSGQKRPINKTGEAVKKVSGRFRMCLSCRHMDA